MNSSSPLDILHSISNILICPNCGTCFSKTDIQGNRLRCSSCNTAYEPAEDGTPDLRTRSPVQVTTEHTIGQNLFAQDKPTFTQLVQSDVNNVDFSQSSIPFHFTRELLSHIPRAKTDQSRMLDLGCGDGLHRPIAEAAGYEFVGIDYAEPGAPIYADAHRLPFATDSFEFVMSMAVLEHLQYPFIAMEEAFRVLQPGGCFLGTVAFLEPFHGDSYYHHTHLGTYNSLKHAGFEIEFVAPSTEWSVIEAQAAMSLFPRMPTLLAKLLMLPTKILHRLWWSMGSVMGRNASTEERHRIMTGSFYFKAHKPK